MNKLSFKQKRERWTKVQTVKGISLSALSLFIFLFLISFTSASGCSWNFGCSSGGGILKNISQTYVTYYNNVTNYTETDPIWLSQKTNYYTKSQVNDINTSMKNYADSLVVGTYNDSWINSTIDNKISSSNTTLYQILMNGSFFNTASSEALWNANYSQFLLNNQSVTNSIVANNASMNNYIASANTTLLQILNNGSYGSSASWSNIINGTIWSWVNNGTLWSQMINATTEPKWNANYSQFLLNNQSVTNSIVANNASMNNYIASANTTLLQILNNGSYLNSAWNATNTSYLTSSSLTPYLLISNWNSTNTSYLTSESLWNANYSLVMTMSNATTQNQSLVNYISLVNT